MSGFLSIVGLAPSQARKSEGSTFANQLEFILSFIGYTVGLGNIWQFAYIAYGHGSGTFLVISLYLTCLHTPYSI